MNILFDGPYEPYPNAGVVKYFREISVSLSQSNSVYFSRQSNAHGCKNIKLLPFTHFRPHKVSFYIEYLWQRFFQKSHINIVHPTEFQLSPSGCYFVKKGAKLIITIHDLIHEKFGAPTGLYNQKSRRKYYENADGYIFVSNSTKRDFSESYPLLFDSKPSRVIWHGNNFSSIHSKSEYSSNQFLYVGSRSGYKNFKIAADAFSHISRTDSSVTLLIAGAQPSAKERNYFCGLENQIIWKTFPNEYELKQMYRNSIALLYTSNYEGFGMPLVEAMSQGCIPIAGNHSSIPEVLGDAGIQVNTYSSEEVASAMQKCLKDKKFTESLSVKSLNRAKVFDWNDTATKTLEFYRSI